MATNAILLSQAGRALGLKATNASSKLLVVGGRRGGRITSRPSMRREILGRRHVVNFEIVGF